MKKTSLAILLIATILLSLASCGNSGVKTYDNGAGFTVTVNQNGLATWNAVKGAVSYEYCFVYDDVTDAHYTTAETSVQIPEGYSLHIRPIFGEDEYGDWCATDTFGDLANRRPLGSDVIHPSEITISVDQNGVATWDAVNGAIGYEYSFVYNNELNGLHFTAETSVQIPEGYCLHVRPVFGENEYGDWCTTDTFGDPANRRPLDSDVIHEYPPVDDPALGGQIAISVDQNGVATWDAVPGAVRYCYQLSYIEGALKNAVINLATVLDTRLTIPEGYMLDVEAYDAQNNVIAHGSTETYGDPDARVRLPQAGSDPNIDLRWENLLYYDLVKNIKRDTVKTQSDGSLYFEAVGPKNDTLRFVGNGVSIAADGGITMSPAADLTCLDAIGCIYSYEFAFSEYGQALNTAISINAAYTFDPDLLHVNSTDQMASIGTFAASVMRESISGDGNVHLNISNLQPNFIAVSSGAYGEDDFTLSELTVFYDESTYATGIDALSFYTDFYTAYLDGEHYDPTRERFSVKEGILDFYLIAFPDTQHIIDQQLRLDAPETNNGVLFGINENLYKIGVLKDSSGNTVSKETYKLTAGSTIQVSIGDRQFDVELPVVSKHTDAQNMHELVPCSYPEATGTINSIVIPLAWADQPHTATDAIREEFFAEMGRIIDKDGKVIADYSDTLAAQNRYSLSKYFDVASYGKLTLQSFVTEWYPTGLNFADQRDSSPSDEFLEKVQSWLFTTYPDMDWTQFDKDANGYFDSVFFLNAGDMGSADYYTIPTFSGGVHFGLTYTGELAGTPQKPNFNSYILTHQHMFDHNVIIHEFGHTLGLIDYYDVTYSGIDAVGTFDMQSGNAGDWNAYSKYAVGWTDPDVVKDLAPGQSVEITIGSLAATGDTIIIPGVNSDWHGNPFSEYIMIDLLDTNADINKVSAANFAIDNVLGVRISHVNAAMEHRDLEVDGKTYTIGTIHIANNYKENGKYNVEVIQAGGDNTFTDKDNLRTTLSADDLFGAGDVFTMEKYADFFTGGKLDDGTDLGYEITIVSVSGGSTPSATVRITRK